MQYYQGHLGAKLTLLMSHGQAPDQSRMKPEWKDLVLNARMKLDDGEIIAADIPGAEPMRSAYLTLTVQSDEEAERVLQLCQTVGKSSCPCRRRFSQHASNKRGIVSASTG